MFFSRDAGLFFRTLCCVSIKWKLVHPRNPLQLPFWKFLLLITGYGDLRTSTYPNTKYCRYGFVLKPNWWHLWPLNTIKGILFCRLSSYRVVCVHALEWLTLIWRLFLTVISLLHVVCQGFSCICSGYIRAKHFVSLERVVLGMIYLWFCKVNCRDATY